MLWHNNPSPSILMVNNTGSPESPVAPAIGQQRLFTRDSDGHLCRIDTGNTITDIETPGVGPGSAGLTLLEQHSAAASSTLDFTASITSAYDTYLIVADGLVVTTNGDPRSSGSPRSGTISRVRPVYKLG